MGKYVYKTLLYLIGHGFDSTQFLCSPQCTTQAIDWVKDSKMTTDLIFNEDNYFTVIDWNEYVSNLKIFAATCLHILYEPLEQFSLDKPEEDENGEAIVREISNYGIAVKFNECKHCVEVYSALKQESQDIEMEKQKEMTLLLLEIAAKDQENRIKLKLEEDEKLQKEKALKLQMEEELVKRMKVEEEEKLKKILAAEAFKKIKLEEDRKRLELELEQKAKEEQ